MGRIPVIDIKKKTQVWVDSKELLKNPSKYRKVKEGEMGKCLKRK